MIVDPRDKESVSIISGALQKVIKEKAHNGSEWDRFDNEEKLAEVLHHVIKTN